MVGAVTAIRLPRVNSFRTSWSRLGEQFLHVPMVNSFRTSWSRWSEQFLHVLMENIYLQELAVLSVATIDQQVFAWVMLAFLLVDSKGHHLNDEPSVALW